MPNYRQNQFLPGSSNRPWAKVQNAPFSYPRRTVRVLEEQTRTQDGISVTSTEMVAKGLDRGFIRNILSSKGTGLASSADTIRRFNFQFNPQDISQSIQMRSDVYFAALQQPEQLVQPMSSIAEFRFDIFLDRTMEVASGSGRGTDIDLLSGVLNPSEDVYQIGVLSDLQILYSIIGQGISQEMLTNNVKILKTLAAREAAGSTLSDEEYAQRTAALDAISTDSVRNNKNIGNSGFLIPLPVRVAFSELYMVDGFVTGTQVLFTKFNTAMVPIQASIGISMNAMYLGFARQETFLTANLSEYFRSQEEEAEAAAEAEVEANREAIAKNAQVLNAARQTANVFVFSCDPSKDWLADLGRTDKSSQIVRTVWYAYGNPYQRSYGGGYDENTDREYKVGFKDSALARRLRYDEELDIARDAVGCKVEQLWKSGVPFTVSYTWTFDVYGAYNTLGDAETARKYASALGRPPLITPPSGGPAHRGSYTQTATASSAKEWVKIREDSIREGEEPTVNNAPYPYPEATQGRLTEDQLDGGPDQPDGGSNPLLTKYYVVNFKAKITFDGTVRSINDWSTIRGDEGFYLERALNWPNNTGYGVYDPSAIPTTSSSGG
jgi:hypothetical protein